VLRGIDFADWESMYIRVVGHPPIHPRLLAGCILYGLSLGIRSSRRLEDACLNRLDFIRLMEGRAPDHATICKFRTQFGPRLKALFRKVGRVGIELGMVTLNQVTLDGTDIRANNSRYNTCRRAPVWNRSWPSWISRLRRRCRRRRSRTRRRTGCREKNRRRRSCCRD
jgi:transposase